MLTKMLVSDGTVLYPNFLSRNDRQVLYNRAKREGLVFRCGCRPDADLLYGISVDLRFFPLHKNYEHERYCSRCPDNKGACLYEEDGTVTVRMKFDVRSFSLPYLKKEEDGETENEILRNCVEQESGNEECTEPGEKPEEEEPEEEKPESYSLVQLVRSINREAYAERVAMNKRPLLSEEYFLSAVRGKLKKVKIRGISKSLGELRVKEDSFSFFYEKVSFIDDTKIGFENSFYQGSRFIPKNVLLHAEEEFARRYDRMLSDCLCGDGVYAAGFIYLCTSRRKGMQYQSIGRITFFPVTKNGIYADSYKEKELLELVMQESVAAGGKFLFPDNEEGKAIGSIHLPGNENSIQVYSGPAARKQKGYYISAAEGVPSAGEIRSVIWKAKNR